MSTEGIDMQMVGRARKKFEKLEETCIERYQTKEQRVLSIIDFCMTTLEQLHSWSLFAIFPLDEENCEKYIEFIEQRFQHVIKPLRLFYAALQKQEKTLNTSGSLQRRDGLRSFQESHSIDDAKPTPREPVSPVQSTFSSNDSGVFGENISLRDRISTMSVEYIKEGQSIKKAVLHKLQKCRKEMRTIYRWGQASLLDLHDVLDDSLSDELYFLVRGKMQRILAVLYVYEEAADQTEKTMSHYFKNQSKDKTDFGIEGPDLVVEFPPKESPRYESMELRLNLCDMMDHSLPTTPRVGRDREEGADSGDSTRGSTPEPPTSPRPKGLVKHPKIMKDKLQNYALPSRFSGLRISSPW